MIFTMSRQAKFKISGLLKRQVIDLREGGLSIWIRKIATLSSIILSWALFPFMFFFMIFIRILKPILYIRFLRLESGRIGHFAGNTEVYLCERDAGLHDRRISDIFYHTHEICNRQLKVMWERTLPVSPVASLILDRIKPWLPVNKEHFVTIVSSDVSSDLDFYSLFARMRPHLHFTAAEEETGIHKLRDLGLSEKAPFICFYTRDSAYLKNVEPGKDWCYHDYRDSKIASYIRAAEKLTQKGYYMIRMGSVVAEKLNTDDPRIIDYAVNGRTDFLDIFLSAKCRFFLGSTGGLNAVPRIFRRPVAYVNFIPLNNRHVFLCTPQSLIIPKKLWSREKKRLLTFREVVDLGADKIYNGKDYETLGLEVVDNTPEEIAALALEMDDRLDGKTIGTAEDEELQKRFWSICGLNGTGKTPPAQIGREFLRQNRELLE